MNRKGSVLLLALWAMVILGLLGASLAHTSSQWLRVAGTPWQQLRFEQAARLAVSDAAKQDISRMAPTLHSEAYSIEEWRAESGKLNLNTATAPTLQRLWANVPGLADAVLDWRDEDSRRRPGGAEQIDYVSVAYDCRNGPFQSLEELLLVRGMTLARFEEFKNDLTLFTDGPVNLLAASPRVLAALGFTETAARSIQAWRQGPDGREATPDDAQVSGLEQLVSSLQRRASLSAQDLKTLRALIDQGQLTLEPEAIALTIRAHPAHSRHAARFDAVMSARGEPGRLLQWRELRR